MHEALPRMNANERAQHALLTFGTGVALVTGLLLDDPSGGAASGVRTWHIAAGLGLLALLGYHLLYLAVRGYVESRGWEDFPLRWQRGDFDRAVADARYVLGRAERRAEADEHRVSQKALYAWTFVAIALLGGTGLGIGFWGRFSTLSALPLLVGVHQGVALLLLASILWHLYGVLTWEGRWSPEWSWITGELDAGKAQLKVPGAWRRHLSEAAARAAPAGEEALEERARERLAQEKEEVQAELEKGNRLALEERYVEALYHYRRALELYPAYSQARYNMARVLARMGEREMAREAYRQFLDADPFHPLARKAQEAIRELESGEQP